MRQPLTDDQKQRLRVIKYVTSGPTNTAGVVKRYHIAPEDVVAYEAQLVTYGLIVAQTENPQPRYTMRDAGWVYIGLSRMNGIALTITGILAAIPAGVFAGDDASVAAGLIVLTNAGLIEASAGFTLNGV